MLYPRDRVMVSLMAYAGLRPSEMRALRWEDVGDRTLVVRSAVGSSGQEKRTKTGSERAVPIIVPLADDLAVLHEGEGERQSSGVVAPFHTDHRNWTTRVFRPARRRAGLDGIPPYALRHTFASLLIQQGLNALEVAYLMGHSSPQMVERVYGHLFAEARLGERRSMEEVALEARHAASNPKPQSGQATS
jgi:integrase